MAGLIESKLESKIETKRPIEPDLNEAVQELKRLLIMSVKDGKSSFQFTTKLFPKLVIKSDEQRTKLNFQGLLAVLTPLTYEETFKLAPHSCDMECRDRGCPIDPRKHDCYSRECHHPIANLIHDGWTIFLP
jgi:hypothetical protein